MEKREEKNTESGQFHKNKLPVLIGGVAAAAAVIAAILFMIPREDHTNTDLAKVVELSSFANGFADWKADGFEESVKTDITVPYPVTNTDTNTYAVYIGTGKINVGVIMQRDEAAIADWDWLMNAQPDPDTQEYYFNCTLTYADQTVGDSKLPLFVISDVKDLNSGVSARNATQNEIQDQDMARDQNADTDMEEQKIPAEIDIAKYVGGKPDDLLQVCDMLSADDSETYSDGSEDIIVKVNDGMISGFKLETEKYPVNFAGTSIGDDFIDISDEELAKYGYSYYGDDGYETVYSYKDQMAGVMFENDESGVITGIYWVSNMMDVINDSEADTESDTSQVQYAQGEVENFAGEYQGSDAVTLYISLGTEVSISEQQGGDTVGTISISTTMGMMEAELWKQDINEYTIYQEKGNAVIGRMTVLEDAVIVTDSTGFDGTYQLLTRYES